MCTANKLASYLEAGIPYICFNNYQYMSKPGKLYGFDISIEPNKLRDLTTKYKSNSNFEFQGTEINLYSCFGEPKDWKFVKTFRLIE